jgi:hypothetical protein
MREFERIQGMISTENCELKTIVVHYVGNKNDEEGFKLSKSSLEIEEKAIEQLLMKYFLSPFKNKEFYQLHHEADLQLNEIYSYCTKIFADPDAFFLQSINIAKHLYEKSTHPMVKGGELYLVYLKDYIVDNDMVDAIGLFKSETKETYLKVSQHADNYEINSEDGININKLDKGCLIFNIDQDKGYRVCVIDNTNKNDEARYWKDHFLKIKPREDNFFHTQNYLQLTKGFIDDKLKESFEVSKVDEIDLLNKSMKYFKEKEVFDFNDFTKEIIQQPEVIDSFREYKQKYQQDREMTIADEFDISANAVKTTSRIFKSVLKLDKNFHVYVHGNREHIVKGYDEEKGMNYYQLFFREEK